MRATVLSLCVLASLSCVEKRKSKKIDPAYIESNLLAELPADIANRVDADLGGKVIYVGNTVDTEVLERGGGGRIVHYWQIVEAPGSEWKVFTHLNGPNQWMNLDLTDMRTGHPPSKWKAGQIIRDEQKFTLDPTWTGTVAHLSIGLYRVGGQTANDRMPVVSGPGDAESRVKAFTFKVSGAAPESAPEYVIRRSTGAIKVDGIADEEAWRRAPKSPSFTTAQGGKVLGKDTFARLLWDEKYLYAFIEVEDDDAYSKYKEKDGDLWKEDVVELFIDADKNRRGYVELQVNPNNTQLDSFFATTRAQPGKIEWSSGMASAVVVDGTTEIRSDTDRGWNVEIAIPLVAVKGEASAMQVNIPPVLGDTWRLNAVRVEKPKSDSLRASSWNPITIQDFHALDRMLLVRFGDEEGAAKPDGRVDMPLRPGAEHEEAEEPEESAEAVVPSPTTPARDAKLKAIKDRAVDEASGGGAPERSPR